MSLIVSETNQLFQFCDKCGPLRQFCSSKFGCMMWSSTQHLKVSCCHKVDHCLHFPYALHICVQRFSKGFPFIYQEAKHIDLKLPNGSL